MNKKVLVTGGAGFIGSHLCKRLLEENNEVLCLDNYFTGNKMNVLSLLDNPLFELIRHDIVNPYIAEVDEIYNLACPASPIHYQHNPIQTVKISVMGAINMLETAKATGAKILQASTSEVYGDPKIHPQVESYWGNVNPIGERSCYDEGKRCAETLFMDYHRQSNLKIKIIRIFNTYGPNMQPHDGRVVSNFGNPNEFTILELAETIIRLTNSKSKLIYNSLPKDDPQQRRPDITLAKEKLDWSPKIELEEGLIKTIYYFDQLLKKKN